MISFQTAALLGGVSVMTVDHRGWSVEEIAQRAADKIVYVGEQSHPVVREQAIVFKEQVKAVVAAYIGEAVEQERAALARKLTQAGHSELVNLLR